MPSNVVPGQGFGADIWPHSDPGHCTSNEGRLIFFRMNILDLKPSFCGVGRPLSALEPRIRSEVYQKYDKKNIHSIEFKKCPFFRGTEPGSGFFGQNPDPNPARGP